MHARPASALEHAARGFAADVSIANDRTGQSADAKSVLGIVGLDIRHGDPCRLDATGQDASRAIEALSAFVEVTLPHVDDANPLTHEPDKRRSLPPVLRQANAAVVAGTPVVPGIGVGRARLICALPMPDSLPRSGVADADAEVERVGEALERLAGRYDVRLDSGARGVEEDLLRAHRSVARDPELARAITRAIRERGLTAAGAIAEAEAQFVGMLAATGSAVLRERALDIRDVCRALLREVYGDALPDDQVTLDAYTIGIAETLTPAQLLALDRRWLKGLVLAHGGTTSHTVILARARRIPTLVGVEGLDASALDGREVVVDADLGAVVTSLNDGVRRYYDMERRRLDRRQDRVRRSIERPAATLDGRRLEVAANVGSAAEVAEAVASGADGIGLFRTEMLFLGRPAAPSEEEQFAEYRRAVENAAGRPVIIRTLDVGGDKPLPYLPLPREDNPFLGCRAVRIYPEFESLFRTQVRALLRASAFGRLQVMIPMVARADEAAWVRHVVAGEQASLAAAGVAFDAGMPVGAMVEVPSAALMVEQLGRVLDFFSIGTNDLLQYFTAVDRNNPRLAALADPLEPSFIRLLGQVVAGARAAGRWVGLCGEMGGHARFLPLMVGLGLDEVSLAPAEIPTIRALVADLSAAGCAALVERAAGAATSREVAQLLDERGHWREKPLTEPDLVELDADCRTKEEAIKAAVDLLSAAGRTDRPRDIEEAVWRREEADSTGFGFGFAIPHCQTDAAETGSMAIVRLRAGVDWKAIDGQPVRTVILLVVREEEAAAHLRVLAALARRLMDEEFRARVEQEQDPAALCELLWRA
jgi:fructose-specific PTS system IIA-like component